MIVVSKQEVRLSQMVGLEVEFEAVVAEQYFFWVLRVSKLVSGFLVVDAAVHDGIAKEIIELPVGIDRLVMEYRQSFGASAGGQLHPHDIAGVSPAGLGEGGVRHGVLGVENDEVGVAEKVHKRVILLVGVVRVLGIGRENRDLATLFKAVAIGLARVVLLDGVDLETFHAVGRERRLDVELDVRSHGVERHWKLRARHLAAQRFLTLFVVGVENDLVARDVGGHEKRKALDVVPVQVRHENVVGAGLLGLTRGHELMAEVANAGPGVTDDVSAAWVIELDARRVGAVGRAHGKRQFAINKRIDLLFAGQILPLRRFESPKNLLAHHRRGHRRGQRTLCSPEADFHD